MEEPEPAQSQNFKIANAHPPQPPCCSVFPCHTPEQVRSELPANTDVVAFQVGIAGRAGSGELGGRRASSACGGAIVVQRQGLHVGLPSNPVPMLS